MLDLVKSKPKLALSDRIEQMSTDTIVREYYLDKFQRECSPREIKYVLVQAADTGGTPTSWRPGSEGQVKTSYEALAIDKNDDGSLKTTERKARIASYFYEDVNFPRAVTRIVESFGAMI